MLENRNRYVDKSLVVLLMFGEIARTSVWGCIYINPQYTRFLWISVILYYICAAISNRTSIHDYGEGMHFKCVVYILILFPLLSPISCYLLEGQSVILGYKAVFATLGPIVYFFLHSRGVSEQTIMRYVVYSSIIVFFIQVIQQLLPDYAIFGIRMVEGLDIHDSLLANMRNGFIRYDFGASSALIQLCLFYFFAKSYFNFKKEYLLMFGIFLVSIYLTLTRQLMVSSLIVLLFSMPICNMKIKLKYIFFLLGCIGIGVLYGDFLFSNFVESAQKDLNNEDYIRNEAYSYFFNESTSDIIAFLMGHGNPIQGSDFDTHIKTLMSYGLFSSDVGFIGDAYRYGWVHACAALYAMISIVVRFRTQIHPHLIMFMMASLLTSVMMFQSGYVLALVLYMCDVQINNLRQLRE